MQRVYEENEWGKASKRIVTLLIFGHDHVLKGSVDPQQQQNRAQNGK